MQPALAQVCSLPAPFRQQVQDYAAGQCRAMELWLTKLETFVEQESAATARKVLEDEGITPAAAGFQGGLLASQGEARKEAWDLFRRRLDLCREVGAETLIVACDVAPPVVQQDIERVQASLVQAAQEAGRRQMRIALEFQGRAVFANNLQTAAALVEQTGSPHLGLCFDAFHYYVGPSKGEDLFYLSAQNLFHVQLCDLADTPREFAADSDRILPGDGDIPLPPIVDRLRAIGYAGPVSLELMNPQLWQVPPRQFGEIALTALRKVLGLAGM